jgi:hypothetical protein
LLKSRGMVPRNARTSPSSIWPTRQPSMESGPATKTEARWTKPAPLS